MDHNSVIIIITIIHVILTKPEANDFTICVLCVALCSPDGFFLVGHWYGAVRSGDGAG